MHMYLLNVNCQAQTACHQPECGTSISSDGGSSKRSSASNQGNDNPDDSTDIPIGLGVGGLQPKVRHCFWFAVLAWSFVFVLRKNHIRCI